MTRMFPTALAISEWPEQDRARWKAALRQGEIFEPDGRAAHWADPTRTQVAKGYGKWLWALRGFGELDAEASPGARVTEDNLRRYVAALEDQSLSSVTIASRVTDLLEAIRVMDPEMDLSLLRGLVSTLQQRAYPSRNKASRIRQPGEIWEACANEMTRIAADRDLPLVEGASRFRDALALGFLVWSPIRRRNLEALELGTNLRLEAGRWRVHFGAEATKDKSPLSFALPDEADYQKSLETYLMRIRPRLLRSNDVSLNTLPLLRGPLWVSTRGGAMTAHALYYAVNRCSKRLLGAPLNPHILRDCAASALTSERPGQVLAAARILGHSQLSTTLTHYEHASMLKAGSLLQEVFDEIRNRHRDDMAASVAHQRSPAYLDPWEPV
jgi:integrase/recombinase XerD